MAPIQGDDGLSGLPAPGTYGVKGESTTQYGVVGLSGGSVTAGVYGRSPGVGVLGSAKDYGVSGWADHVGVFGGARSEGTGVIGVNGAFGVANVFAAIEGENAAGNAAGVRGVSHAGTGIIARTDGLGGPNNRAVYAKAGRGAGAAIEASCQGPGWGILAHSGGPAGAFWNDEDPLIEVYLGSKGLAGFFLGPVKVYGMLWSSDKRFIIDHPQDPANKYLEHASVESDERKNLYDGIVVLGAKGEAEVELPGWFAALNRDFRYQLTCLGKPAPVYIAQEIEGNRFRIAGGQPGLKVSWQVTGIRQDAWAQTHPFAVERDKPEDERGFYIEPALYGEPPEKRVGRAPRPEPVPAELLERHPKIEELLERLKGDRGEESGPSESSP